MMIGGKGWGFQYSPYAYFHEHCIFLDLQHEPMKIDQQTLVNLVEIEKTLPHYFVGSNADLPIVGVQCWPTSTTKVAATPSR